MSTRARCLIFHRFKRHTLRTRGYEYRTKYLKSGGFLDGEHNKTDDDDEDGNRKTLISDIIKSYNAEYTTYASENKSHHIISAAQSIPKFKYLYIVQLVNPFNSASRINVVGIKQESMTEQDEVAGEIKKLLHLLKPKNFIIQLSADRYLNAFDIENDVPHTYSLSSLLSQQHLTNSVRIALHLINYVTQNNVIRMNPYLYAVLYANNEANGCSFIDNIILGDIPYSREVIEKNNEAMFEERHRYIASTTYKERQKYASYPGMWQLLFSMNSVSGVFEWLNINKATIKLKERDVYQFAIDMQHKLKFGQDILQSSTKSMAYYTYKCVQSEAEREGETETKMDHNVLVLCNIFTMLSFPMHFGNVTKQDIEDIKANKNENKIKGNLYKKWIFNYWNGVWWTLCVMHTTFQTGIYNLDYPYLLQFGIVLPIMYPTIYMAISFRARHRVRKLQQIILKQNKKKIQNINANCLNHTIH
eukprot:318663_1